MHLIRAIRLLAILAVWLTLGLDSAKPQAARDAIPQAKLVGESQRTASRLASAQRKLEEKQWAEAIEELQAVLDEAGDDLVPLDGAQPRHCLAARRLCQLFFAALPPAALKQYRSRVDPAARKLLEQAEPTRDVGQLKRLAEDYFASRPSERALDLLGDLAFERGDFHEAERWWRHLIKPLAALQPGELRYPDSQLDPALVRAKLVLAALFRGDRNAAQEQLKTLRAAHPKSAGELAGDKGNYADILQKLLDQKDLTPPPGDDAAWPTFAGAASRSHALAQLPRVRWLEEPWRVRLDGKPTDPKAEELPPVNYRNASEAARALAYYPVIAGNRVLFADARFVSVHDLNTGRRLFRYDLLANAGPRIEPEVPVKHDERFTLTVADGRVYVRLGLPMLGFPKEGEAAPASYLLCLDLPAGNEGELTRRWQVTTRADAREQTSFEGSPIVQGGRVWIAQTHFHRNVAATALECYDAATGTRRWRQEICEATELMPDGAPRYRPHLLTLAGPNLVYCSHSGAVVAVDAATGKRSWGIRYARRGPKPTDGQLSPRDLAPPVYGDGRVYVAPADFDRILCLDVLTGRTLWESNPIEVVHLLGVARGKLIFTTGNQPRGIRALDATTGNDLRGWLQPDDGQGELPSLGRAVFAGDWLLWPTVREGLRILNLEDGRVAEKHFLPPGIVRSGNLAVANGCVVVATDRELLGYVAPARLFEPRKKAAALEPKSAEAQLRLAVAEADSGQPRDAARRLAEAWQLTREPRLRAEIAGRAYALGREVGMPDDLVAIVRAAGQDRPLPARHAVEPRPNPSAERPPRLGLPLQEAWHASAEDRPERMCLTDADRESPPDFVLFRREPDGLVCRETATGKVRWEQRCSAPVCWTGADFERVLVGGPERIVCRSARDGAELWTLAHDVTPGDSGRGYDSFQLSSGRLFCIADDNLLLGIDVATGKTLWQQLAPGAAVRPLEPAGQFNPHYHAGKDR
ncbi:MAG: PQQ-binding-like beta-propeller repeat protein, partial [Planctomycetia bacterium]|nr:PQQ-binding-like beta-propeller repeat protein [Planctomycetia bacterium]